MYSIRGRLSHFIKTACSCDGTVEGPVIRCNGIDGLLIVDKLKASNMEIKEFTLENANIIEVRTFKNFFKNSLSDWTTSIQEFENKKT